MVEDSYFDMSLNIVIAFPLTVNTGDNFYFDPCLLGAAASYQPAVVSILVRLQDVPQNLRDRPNI